MAANAEITGEVEYRAGDGPLIGIPHGPCEVEMAADSAVISWGEEGNVQTTAIPMAEFNRYLKEGAITLAS